MKRSNALRAKCTILRELDRVLARQSADNARPPSYSRTEQA
ncbi:hypothetical protein [Methylobacterium soli]|jgi:hypothetical protein|nr:hypothetical protein [Methylobacterium soli]